MSKLLIIALLITPSCRTPQNAKSELAGGGNRPPSSSTPEEFAANCVKIVSRDRGNTATPEHVRACQDIRVAHQDTCVMNLSYDSSSKISPAMIYTCAEVKNEHAANCVNTVSRESGSAISVEHIRNCAKISKSLHFQCAKTITNETASKISPRDILFCSFIDTRSELDCVSSHVKDSGRHDELVIKQCDFNHSGDAVNDYIEQYESDAWFGYFQIDDEYRKIEALIRAVKGIGESTASKIVKSAACLLERPRYMDQFAREIAFCDTHLKLNRNLYHNVIEEHGDINQKNLKLKFRK